MPDGSLLWCQRVRDELANLAEFTSKSDTWSAIVTIPLLVVAYVVGLLAIALVEGVDGRDALGLGTLQGLAAQRYSQLRQEAEILSGSVVGFLLLAVAAFLNVWAHPGWARTLSISALALLLTSSFRLENQSP